MPFLPDRSDELRPLNKHEKQIVALTVCGAFFSCFDFTIYFFFNDAISHAFFPDVKSGWLESTGFLLLILIGYISRPLGGVVMSHLGDKLGRKRIMLSSLFIVSIPTLLIGMLPTYEQIGVAALFAIMILRFLQGFGFGGEVPASWVCLAEHMPRRHVGTVCGLLIASFMLSSLASNLLATFINSILTPAQMASFGWRVPFLVGALGTIVAIMLRRRMLETPIWLYAQAQQTLCQTLPLKQVLQKYQYGVLMTFGLSWFTSSVFLTNFLLMAELGVKFFDIPASLMDISSGIGCLFAAIGATIYGVCADRFNSGRVLAVGSILLFISCILYFATLRSAGELLILSYAVFGFCSGVIGIVPSICVRLFPVEVRMTGVGITYNIAYAITGALIPLLMNTYSEKIAITPMLYIAFLCVLGVIMSLFLSNLHGLYRMEERHV